MNRYIRLAILTVAFAHLGGNAAAAQVIGINGGLSRASIAGNDADRAESIRGIKAGAAATFPLDGNFEFQVGAAFVEKGFKVGDHFSIGMDYIEVPVMLRISVPVDGRISPHLAGGLGVGFNIGCRAATFFEGNPGNVDCEEIDFESKGVDWGFMANAGLSIATSDKLSVTFDVAYDTGRSSVVDDFGGVVEVFRGFDRPVTNRAWSFLMGVALPIK